MIIHLILCLRNPPSSFRVQKHLVIKLLIGFQSIPWSAHISVLIYTYNPCAFNMNQSMDLSGYTGANGVCCESKYVYFEVQINEKCYKRTNCRAKLLDKVDKISIVFKFIFVFRQRL